MSWHPLTPVDATIFTTAPQLFRYTVDVPVPPARLWDSLTSQRSIADWAPGVAVRWTAPRPFGVGTTREVTLPLKAITVRETFFRWDEGSGYSFYAAAANRPILETLAEDYVIEARPGGARLLWTVAITPAARWRRLLQPAAPVTRAVFGQVARGAKSYLTRHP